MAQSVVTGLTGSITLPSGLFQYIHSISLNVGSELLDVSHYGGNGYRVREVGLKDLGGSCVAFMSKGSTLYSPLALDGAAGSMTISFDTSCYVTFTAIVSGVSIVGEYGGLNVVTFNFANHADTGVTTGWA